MDKADALHPREWPVSTQVYFFGCGRDVGHYWHGPHLRYVSHTVYRTPPWQDHDIDGKAQPTCREETRHGKTRWVSDPEEQEGPARIHHRKGWTMLSFWDRSVDKRFASNGSFVAKGEHDHNGMMDLAQEHFPELLGRLTAPLRPETGDHHD